MNRAVLEGMQSEWIVDSRDVLCINAIVNGLEFLLWTKQWSYDRVTKVDEE
jgi:hypothetical protein